MAVLRKRRGLVLLVALGSTLLCATLLSTYYTTIDQRTIVSGDGPLLINDGVTYNAGSVASYKLFDSSVTDKLFLEFVDNQHPESKIPSARNMMRLHQMTLACSMLTDNNVFPPNQQSFQHIDRNRLMINREKQMMYCYLPKVANTNFRRVFLGLEGVVPKSEVPSISGYDIYFTHNKKFTYLNRLNQSEQTHLLKTYKKFVFVRDPLERLLSAYRNKFFHPNERHKAEYHDTASNFYGRHPELRKEHRMRVDFQSKEMTFNEFLIYFTDVFDVREFFNEHFVPSNQLCNPCGVHYDYIGKYETLNTDVKYLFDELKIDIDFPGRNDNYSSVPTHSLVEQYYKLVPDWLLHKTWDILKFDLAMFGYKLPVWFRERLQMN